MRVFLTGGTGFIGGHVARKLRERGDEVRALVRSADRARELVDLECEIVSGTLADEAAIREGIDGCDVVIHGAAIYEVGIPASRRPELYAANVEGTRTVLGAALDAGVKRALYISTIGAFGNTRGQVVDETYEHPGEHFGSYYEETKTEAHRIAREIGARGLPLVIVQPGGVYGPDDHSQLGNLIRQFKAGRLPLLPFPDWGISFVHVEDVADGVLLALDGGEDGESYLLGGEIATMRDFVGTLAKITGKRAPIAPLPTFLLKAIAPVGPIVGPLLGYPPNMGELIRNSDGTTMWASSAKAKQELGYGPRSLEQGLRDTLAEHSRRRSARSAARA